MGIVINGSSAAGTINLGSNGTITNLAVGGIPDGTIDNGCMADDAIDSAELADGGIDSVHLASGVGGKVLNWNTKTTTTAVSYSNYQSNHTVWTSDALTVSAGSTILVIASYHVWRQDASDANHYGKIAIEQEIGGSGTWTHIKGVGTAGYEFGELQNLGFQHNYHQSWTHGQSAGTSIKIRLRDEVQSPEENLCVYQRNGNGSCLTVIEVGA